MYQINKITSHPVVDFAAEELKKYLRMMMPRCGEVPIAYNPKAKDGFRIGIMAEFSLDTSEAQDLELDDIIHIDTDSEGGVIAGSNPRSVLLAVYKYLTLNGCCWLFPGVDGEFIPVQPVVATSYHKMADCRYRGQCNEGAESQQCMLETIDFSPKIGLNAYMIEFDNPMVYYDWYYSHTNNEANREAEPVSPDTILQWKRACEAEIAKRGLQYHDMGHGWTAESFGISSIGGWGQNEGDNVPEEARQYLAMRDGVRGLHKGVPLNTNFCMSNPKARKLVVSRVCDYAQIHTNVDYLHVWLADSQRNHCECDACRKKIPSDWYVVLLNEIDEELTRRNLGTKITFCVYSDTAYEPTCEHIKNPARFSFLLGAISRSYTYSVEKNPVLPEIKPYVLNVSGRFDTMEEYIYRANLWRNFAACPSFAYEYHFWKHQFYAPGVLSFARRLYEDVLSYKANGFDGIIQDGSQRSFFPNGLSFYVYALTLFDTALDYDALVEDYFRHAYGEAWKIVKDYFEEIERVLPQDYVQIRHNATDATTHYLKPEMVPVLKSTEEVTRRYADKLKAYRNMPYRVQTVAVRLLDYHFEFCYGLADCLSYKAVGDDEKAKEVSDAFFDEFGKCELAIERYYDHMMMRHAMKNIFGAKKQLNQ